MSSGVARDLTKISFGNARLARLWWPVGNTRCPGGHTKGITGGGSPSVFLCSVRGDTEEDELEPMSRGSLKTRLDVLESIESPDLASFSTSL